MPHALPVSKSVGLAVAFACCAAMAQDRPATGHGADSPASQEALTKPAATPARTYDLQFATYFGGSGADLIRHMTADASGNIYVAGTAGSADFPRTPGAIPGASDSNGAMVAKFSPSGKLLWSKVCGTGKEIYFYTVIPDAQGNVFVAGRMGPGFPTTPGAIQPTTAHVCGFVGKLKSDGSAWIWASYVGAGYAVRDMAMDNKGDLYCVLDYYAESKEVLPAKWFANAYCKTPHTGDMNHFGHCDAGIIKISNDGNVAWASWIGGTGGNDWVACVGVDSNHCPVILMRTASADMPTTPDAHSQALPKGLNQGGWLGKLSADGSKLIFGTYIADAFPRTHNLALDAQGNIFICTCTKDWPATPGALQTKFGGGPEDFGVAKFSPTGKLLAATYIGGNGDETNGPDQIVVDASGNVVIAGSSSSTDYPMTAGAFQPKNASPRGAYPFDGVVSMLSSDLGTLLYSTYVGGTGDEMARACFVGQDGTLYVGGVTTSKNFPVKNAWQPNYGGNPDWDYFKPNGGNFPACWGNGDCFIMKLRPDATAAQTPVKDR